MEQYPGKVQAPQGHAQGYGQPYGYPQMQMYGQPPVYGQQSQQSIVTTQSTVAYVAPNNVIVTSGVRPPSGMVLAILACIFCFWPTGIGAIMYASQGASVSLTNTVQIVVKSLVQATTEVDNNEAWRKYRMSRMLTIISVIVGIIWISIAIWRIVYAVNYTTYYYYG